MQVPLEIRYHHLDRSESLDVEIREHVDKLDRMYDHLVACRVAVECQHHQHRTGNVCDVHIELSVPGQTLVVSREPHKAKSEYAHPDVHTAVKAAFRAAERQLTDFKRKQRGDVKHHAVQLTGSIAQLLPEQDHGFLLTSTGALLYFNRTSLMDEALENLQTGETVHYIEIDGDSGPLASKVWRAKDDPDL